MDDVKNCIKNDQFDEGTFKILDIVITAFSYIYNSKVRLNFIYSDSDNDEFLECGLRHENNVIINKYPNGLFELVENQTQENEKSNVENSGNNSGTDNENEG